MDYVSKALNAHKEALPWPQRKEFDEKIKNLGVNQRANIAMEIMKQHPQFRDVVAKMQSMQVGGIYTMPDMPGKVGSTEITSQYTPKKGQVTKKVKAPIAAKDKSAAKEEAKTVQQAEAEKVAENVAKIPLSELSEDIYSSDELPQYVQAAQEVPKIKPYIPLTEIDKFDENLMPRGTSAVSIKNPDIRIATPYDYQGEYQETVPVLKAGVPRESSNVTGVQPNLIAGEPYKFKGKYQETKPNIEQTTSIVNIDPNLHPELAKASTLPSLKGDSSLGYVTQELGEVKTAPFKEIKGTPTEEQNIRYIKRGNEFWLYNPQTNEYENRNWNKDQMLQWAKKNNYKLGVTKFRYR